MRSILLQKMCRKYKVMEIKHDDKTVTLNSNSVVILVSDKAIDVVQPNPNISCLQKILIFAIFVCIGGITFAAIIYFKLL